MIIALRSTYSNFISFLKLTRTWLATDFSKIELQRACTVYKGLKRRRLGNSHSVFPDNFLPLRISLVIFSRLIAVIYNFSLFLFPGCARRTGSKQACRSLRFDRFAKGLSRREREREREGKKKGAARAEIPFSSWTFTIFLRPNFPGKSCAASNFRKSRLWRAELVESLIA